MKRIQTLFLIVLLVSCDCTANADTNASAALNPTAPVMALINSGKVQFSQKLYSTALVTFQSALDLANKSSDKIGIDWANCDIGATYAGLNQLDDALKYDLQGEMTSSQNNDVYIEYKTYQNAGDIYRGLNQYSDALKNDQTWEALCIKNADVSEQMSSLNNISVDFEDLKQYSDALKNDQLWLSLAKSNNNPGEIARAELGTGIDNDILGNFDLAISNEQLALSQAQKNSDSPLQETVLSRLASLYGRADKPDLALQYLQKYLDSATVNKDISGQRYALKILGKAYRLTANYSEALDYDQKSATLEASAGDLAGQQNAYQEMGLIQIQLGRMDLAATDLQLAETDSALVKDDYNQCMDMTLLALCLYFNGDQDGSRSTLQGAETLITKMQDKSKNSGNSDTHQLADIAALQERLTLISKAVGLALSTTELGGKNQDSESYKKLGQLTDEYSSASSKIFHSTFEAAEANLIKGESLEKQGSYAGAVAPLLNAYEYLKDSHQKEDIAECLAALMIAENKVGNKSLAAYYGKESINLYQSIRGDVSKLDKDSQKTFLGKVQRYYHELADILIDQGRLPEAEQVLGMLKDQEVLDYVRRDSAAKPPASRTLTLDTSEQAVADKDAALSAPIIAIGAQIDALERQKPRPGVQIAALQKQLEPAVAAYNKFLKTQLPSELVDAKVDTQKQAQQITDAEGPLQKTLHDLGPGTVALFTLIEPDKYRVVVVTAQTETAEEHQIPSGDLRKLIFDWRDALKDPNADPKPLGEKLYNILIGPIKADLDAANAKVLMWSLDDDLRYVPMAALYDGKQYMVERYQNTVFTGGNAESLGNAPQADWSVLGVGVSKAHDVDGVHFDELRSVPAELNGIVKQAGNHGILPGSELLDDTFTQTNFYTGLANGNPVVHIASHFDVGATNQSTFLLLGDGTPLRMSDFDDKGQVFQGVDLLTLSACETAVGVTDGDGHEFESFATLAQDKGASSILASLWPVADASTQLLMDGFYQDRGTGTSAITKAAALQGAQLALLHGTGGATTPAPANNRDATPDSPTRSATSQPSFTPDPKAPFAHPYYWAPFVLIGDWK